MKINTIICLTLLMGISCFSLAFGSTSENSKPEQIKDIQLNIMENILSENDYNSFLDSVIIKNKRIICANIEILNKYSDSSIISDVIQYFSDNGITTCSFRNHKAKSVQDNILKTLVNSERKELMSSLVINGNAIVQYKLNINSEQFSKSYIEKILFSETPNYDDDLLTGYTCKAKILGNGFHCVKTDDIGNVCYRSTCESVLY